MASIGFSFNYIFKPELRQRFHYHLPLPEVTLPSNERSRYELSTSTTSNTSNTSNTSTTSITSNMGTEGSARTCFCGYFSEVSLQSLDQLRDDNIIKLYSEGLVYFHFYFFLFDGLFISPFCNSGRLYVQYYQSIPFKSRVFCFY